MSFPYSPAALAVRARALTASEIAALRGLRHKIIEPPRWAGRTPFASTHYEISHEHHLERCDAAVRP